ncbi:MAG: redoxin family protein [Planctomycetales bacterium]|nr:redoxin family protein [Planctomycetales bacterium]
MLHVVFQWTAFCLLAAPAPADTWLTYHGEIVAERDDEAATRKSIIFEVLVVGPGERGARIWWKVTEKGRGGWQWADRFGEAEIDDRGRLVGGSPASLLYRHDDGMSAVPLIAPWIAAAEPLAAGATWREDRLEYAVREAEGGDPQTAWLIDVRSPIGHKRTLTVRRDAPLIESWRETVFMGPGKRHRLTMTLVDETKLADEESQKLQSVFAELAAARQAAGYERGGPRGKWTDAQLKVLREKLPPIIDQAVDTKLAELSVEAAADARLQSGVQKALAALRQKFEGAAMPPLDLPAATLSGQPLKTDELRGRVAVLHFWPYADKPLHEPYGQVGYVDFLHRRYKDRGVAVFGISVDERLDQPERRSDAIRSVRNLQAFMNVGYPLTLGGGRALEALGDPQRAGAELPLVVVLDGDGRIAHYHTGLYDVDRDHGLKELHEVLDRLTK